MKEIIEQITQKQTEIPNRLRMAGLKIPMMKKFKEYLEEQTLNCLFCNEDIKKGYLPLPMLLDEKDNLIFGIACRKCMMKVSDAILNVIQ